VTRTAGTIARVLALSPVALAAGYPTPGDCAPLRPFTTLVISVRGQLARGCVVVSTPHSGMPRGKLVCAYDGRCAVEPLTLDELVEMQGVQPIASVDELVVDLWTDDELDAFLRSRYQSYADGEPL